jgi:hypothetical protein
MKLHWSPPSRLSGRFLSVIAFLSLTTVMLAQVAPPLQPAYEKYDADKSHRANPGEGSLIRADKAKTASLPTETSGEDGEVLQLSPFEVKESNSGYLATNTMSGTRLNTKLEDLGSSISVVGNKLSFRASRYTTNQINARNGQNAVLANRMLQLDLNNYAGSARVIPLQRQATAWVMQLNPGFSTDQVRGEVLRIMQWQPDWENFYRTHTMSETQGIAAKGDEFELTYNPSSYWTLKANATKSAAIDDGIAQSVYDYHDDTLPGRSSRSYEAPGATFTGYPARAPSA